MKKCYTTSRFHFCFALFAALLFAPRFASAQNGINSDGTDFFVGFMPGIGPTQSRAGVYFLICSYQSNNFVHIDYFESNGLEVEGQNFLLRKGQGIEYFIDPSLMFPTRPGEVLEYKSAHITSNYPISVQVYSEGSGNGSMYQAIPTAALGKNYVVAAYNDNPLADNPGYVNRDSSSSEFLIIAPYDHTHVMYIPNSTTQSLGTVGVNSGPNSNGTAHPVTIEMQRGEVYWVRSSCNDINQDESGSTVTADKPIAVLGGQERAMIGYPSGYWTTLDNDIRNEVAEEMTPTVDWGTEYPSIPSMPASITDVTIVGDGDMYRVYTDDSKGMEMNYWEHSSAPYAQYGPNAISLYGLPATQFDNVLDPIDMLTDPNSKDAAGNLKKFYAVQYFYFQGHHDFDPNRRIGTGKAGTPQSGGGDGTLDETSYRAEEEMDLIPIDHWKASTIFMVPPNSAYNGYQFINVITYKDSVQNINITRNNATTGSLVSFIPPAKMYQIPLHPELIGLTIKLPTGTYIISGNTPFQCNSYGRTETRYKDIFGYAAPCGEAYGSHAQPNPPQADITGNCGLWNVRVHERGTGGGIAEVMLLDDSGGYIVKPAYVSYNCSLIGNGTDPQNLMSPPFMVGDTSLSITVQVNDLSRNAYAAVYAVDLSGNDTVIQLSYVAQSLALSASKLTLPDTTVESAECSSVTLKVKSTGTLSTLAIVDSAANNVFQIITTPKLPAQLKAGDSVTFNICYTPQDTFLHEDSIRVGAGCIDTTIYIGAKGLTPIIVAGDHDFGDVRLGDTVCSPIPVKNIGNAPLILTNGYQLGNNPDYTFAGQTPDTIPPGTEVTLQFCFHPSKVGEDDSRMNWATNITGVYAHHNKDSSLLIGGGLAAGVNFHFSTSEIALSIAPNPVSGLAMITLTGAPSGNVQIFDVLGREVASFRMAGSYEWNMATLPAGTYILRAEANGVIISKRIVKQ